MQRRTKAFGQFQYPTSPLSVLPQVGKNAAEATAKLVPLQRKTEEEKAARKAAKAAKKAKTKKKTGTGNPKDKANLQARAKKKAQRKKRKK
ncbi:hypothetical protein AB0N07_03920 [Streptomyces sp. NPDC051172]|uniref:hypothetical protein n=1 Tax=Streptomyces sp. NPDC051172 TaxID=3155796 RepID=UPI00343B26A0